MSLRLQWADLSDTLPRVIRAIFLIVVAFPAMAHESRPGYLQMTEKADHGYEVLWKQPVMGELAVHLLPHLSDGWLETEPTSVEVTDSYAIRRWTIAPGDHRSLEDQTVSVEGLENTITNVFVVVRLADGSAWRDVLTPAHPQLMLHVGERSSVALPAFVMLGIEHILTGPDHLLFILGLLLVVHDRWMLLKTVTAFTAAHSITLALAALGITHVSEPLANTAIALSVAFLGTEGVRRQRGGTSLTIRNSWVIAFAFGLLHGFGFASGLTTVGLPHRDIPLALLLFNVGVEIGQLAFVALMLSLRAAIRVLAIRWPEPIRLLPAYTVGSLGALWTIQGLQAMVGG
jgi:hydrogenase/urease accessory protein HupE